MKKVTVNSDKPSPQQQFVLVAWTAVERTRKGVNSRDAQTHRRNFPAVFCCNGVAQGGDHPPETPVVELAELRQIIAELQENQEPEKRVDAENE